MTVIVWDGTTLAADTQETFGNTPTRTSKLLYHRSKIKPDGKNRLVLFGMAGISSECAEARRRIAAGKELLRQDFTDIVVLAVDEGGKVWVAGPDFYWRERPIVLGGRSVCATGSGADYALGALALGASAVKAAEVACELDVSCGLPIDCISVT